MFYDNQETTPYCSVDLVSFVLFEGIYSITPDNYQLSQKLVAALIVITIENNALYIPLLIFLCPQRNSQ